MSQNDAAETPLAEAARAAIGEGAPDDFIIAPETHAATLPAEAAPLSRILKRKTIEPLIAAYSAADASAIRAQSWYKRLGKLSIRLRFVTVSLGAATLMIGFNAFDARNALGEATGEADASTLISFLIFLQFTALSVAVIASWASNRFGFFERWMAWRSEAETARLSFFYRVVGAEEPAGSDELPTALLQLEYFRRYQLDVQSAFYSKRARQAAAAAGRSERAILLQGLLAFASLAPVFYGAAQFFAPEAVQRFVAISLDADLAFVALGLLAAGYGSYLFGLSQLELNRRNAARYGMVAKDLRDFASAPLEAARQAAERDDKAAMMFFVDTVQSVVSSENQEWIQLWKLRQRLSRGG